MSECIYCEEDAGEGYDVCLNCRNKSNFVTIGTKDMMYYIKKIFVLGTEHNIITIKVFGDNVEKFNLYLKPMFEFWGLEEYKRRWVKEKGREGKVLNSLHIRMEMIPSLRGIKTDKGVRVERE